MQLKKTFFHHNKTTVPLRDVDFEKRLVFDKFLFDEKSSKSFIGYLYNDHKVKPLHIMLPKASAYVKSYDGQTKRVYFLIEDDDLLKKYNTIRDQVSADIKKEKLITSLSIINNF